MSQLTKKSYEMIAKRIGDNMKRCEGLEEYHLAVGEHKTAYGYQRAEDILKDLVFNLAFDFAEDNPRFDSSKFKEACGVGNKKDKQHICGVVPDYLKD